LDWWENNLEMWENSLVMWVNNSEMLENNLGLLANIVDLLVNPHMDLGNNLDCLGLVMKETMEHMLESLENSLDCLLHALVKVCTVTLPVNLGTHVVVTMQD